MEYDFLDYMLGVDVFIEKGIVDLEWLFIIGGLVGGIVLVYVIGFINWFKVVVVVKFVINWLLKVLIVDLGLY